MKTQDFIAKHLNTTDGKERTCASVKTDGKGNFWSYGEHYPLIVNIDGHFFLNTAGYSSTTGKHIRWASPFCNCVYDYNFMKNKASLSAKNILAAIKDEIVDINNKLGNLTARAFNKRERLTSRLAQLQHSENVIVEFYTI